MRTRHFRSLTELILTRGGIRMLAALALILIAGHGVLLYYGSSHVAASAGSAAVVALVMAIKHLGLLRSGIALLRRRSRKADELSPPAAR